MKTRIIVFFVLLAISKNSFGQSPVEVKYTQNEKGEILFQGINRGYCDYLVVMNFDRVTNSNSPSTVKVNLRPGTYQVYKLTPARANQSIGFGFSYFSIKGNNAVKLSSPIQYILPVKDGKMTHVDSVKNITEVLGKGVEAGWYALNFSMEEGDTVYAARTGYVNEVNAGSSAAGAGAQYLRSTNSVEIFHADGTFAKYALFKNDGIFVKPGEKIFAGDPIGVIGKIYPSVSLQFMVYYLDNNKISLGLGVSSARYSTLKPKFAVAENGGIYLHTPETYTGLRPDAVLTSEMTNKEIKNRGKK